jgi:hypothetical protein
LSSQRRAAWLPNETQELLLHAALEDGELAAGAWDEWYSRTEMIGADNADIAVLPLAWRNLNGLDGERPGLERLRGVYRHTWIRNQLLVRFGAQVVRELRGDGIDALVLKGVALNLLHYPDMGTRPMADLDVLVPRESAHDAISVLRRTLAPDPEFPRPERRVSVHHSSPFTDGAEMEVDLHWYSLWQSSPDDDFWDAAVPIELAGVGAVALCPADQLLQVTAHGAAWNPAGILRWVADAVTVIRSSPELDWDRFVAQAAKRELTAGLPEALSYLRSEFGAEVPAAAIDELRRTPVRIRARAARRARERPLSALGVLTLHWDRYRRLRSLDPSAPRERSFPSQLRVWWGYDSNADFGRHVVRRARGSRP